MRDPEQRARCEAMIEKMRGKYLDLPDEPGFGVFCSTHGYGCGGTCTEDEELFEGATEGDRWAIRAARVDEKPSGYQAADQHQKEVLERLRDEEDAKMFLGGAPGQGEYVGLEMIENVRRRRAGLGERAITWGIPA